MTWFIAFVAWCTCATVVDASTLRLPNVLTGTGAAGVLIWAGFSGRSIDALVGGGSLFATYLVVHLAIPAAFGAGDVKLAFTVGAVALSFGWDAWAAAAVGAPLLTGVVGVVCTAMRNGRTYVPHGPSMCAATLLAIGVVPT